MRRKYGFLLSVEGRGQATARVGATKTNQAALADELKYKYSNDFRIHLPRVHFLGSAQLTSPDAT